MRQHHDPSRASRFVLRLPKLPAICLVAGSVFASTGPAWSATPADPAAAVIGVPASKASFTRSGLRTATYEIGNALDNLVFLSVGSGGLASGVLLTAFNTAQSWTVYTTNDYLWQKYYPPKESRDGTGAFDVQQSAWRTTLKYMTGKPVVASIKIAALYVYTGSVATAFGYGLAATAGASVIFFVNNLAWDYYDQMVANRNASAPRKVGPE
jgi:uncharacterized membrane protein